jgi:hypothetical protein
MPSRAVVIGLALLAGCSDDAIKPQTPPVVMTYPLKIGEEVVCEETLTRIGLGVHPILPGIGWAKRTFRCEVRLKPPGSYYKSPGD